MHTAFDTQFSKGFVRDILVLKSTAEVLFCSLFCIESCFDVDIKIKPKQADLSILLKILRIDFRILLFSLINFGGSQNLRHASPSGAACHTHIGDLMYTMSHRSLLENWTWRAVSGCWNSKFYNFIVTEFHHLTLTSDRYGNFMWGAGRCGLLVNDSVVFETDSRIWWSPLNSAVLQLFLPFLLEVSSVHKIIPLPWQKHARK